MTKHLYYGKSCEHQVLSLFLSKHLNVFTPVVDTGIDFVVRKDSKTYWEFQVKGRQPRWIFNMAPFKPKRNLYFVLIAPDKETYIVPSRIIYNWLDPYNKVNINKERMRKMQKRYQGSDFLLKKVNN